MTEIPDFSEMAPYSDAEVRAVMKRLAQDPRFFQLLQVAGLGNSKEAMAALVNGINTIEDFQLNIIKPWILNFLYETTDEVTYEGIDKIIKDRRHLFISNHRDIILDSLILNFLFSNHQLQTVEIAIGNNLLQAPLVKTLTKLNKSFTVFRNAGRREMYRHSLTLSTYIRSRIVSGESGIWLAQREGRAKDGNDQTQPGLIKMLNLSNEGSFEDGFRELAIRPVAMSYEFDPCDRFKLKELLAKTTGKKYEKEKDEDLQNMITGIQGYKGGVHLSVQAELAEELEPLRTIKNINEKISKLTELIDQSIYRGYKLFGNNYVAHDLLNRQKRWEAHYSKEQEEAFTSYIEDLCDGKPAVAREIILKKYAYPLINKLSANV